MNRITGFTVLLGGALIMVGCKTAPAPRTTQTGSSSRQSVNEDTYNRTYQSESHHRHHHGRREEGSNDNWTSYDREGATGEPSSSRDADTSLTRSADHHNRRALTAAPGQFDFYVLNLSWSPEFCHTNATAAECAQHRTFTLHGLWPQNVNGTYPEDCSEAPGPANPSQYADIYPDPALLQHEWQTHGTCSGLGPDQFFALARRAEQSIPIPATLAHLTQQIALTPAQIVTLFTQNDRTLPASSLAITCGNNYLTAVEVCMDKNLKPESCSAVKTCGAKQIRIPAPQ